MRALALIPLCVLAACSDGGSADSAKAEPDTAALQLAAGQWETTTVVGAVTSQDNGTPVMKEGETSTVSNCVGEAEGKKPPAPVLAGIDSCTYDTIYMSRGRITAALSCTKPALKGRVMVSSEGSYTADSFDTNAVIQTNLFTEGDVKALAKISGKRVGACTPKAA